jgi:hypothetical protein
MPRVLVINLEGPGVDAIRIVQTECVLDIAGLGDVTGVEILSLVYNTGCWVPGSRGMAILGSGERVGWSYDHDADAFYASIDRRDRTLDQRVELCSVGIAEDGRLISVTVEMEER